jgi:uncharacterized protein (DUF1697 family)
MLEVMVAISLLRGVNVGGRHKIKMDALRALYESLGLRDPQTYVQSGNVVFRTEKRSWKSLAKRIEDGIEGQLGFRPSVILRTSSELQEVVAANPFGGTRGLEPSKLLVFFLSRDPGPEARRKVLEIDAAPEELRFGGREIYIYFPNGVGRSKFPWAAMDKVLNAASTGRNWNTVTKLLEMAERLESA